jgi:hypothetical protein
MSSNPTPNWVLIVVSGIGAAGVIIAAVIGLSKPPEGKTTATPISSPPVISIDNTNNNGSGAINKGNGSPTPTQPGTVGSPTVPNTQTPAPQFSPSEGTITTPSNGKSVKQQSSASGTAPVLKTDEKLWLYVYAPGAKKYFPARTTINDGVWSAALWVGGPGTGDVGAEYTVGIIVTDAIGSQKIEPEIRPDSPGLDALPQSARQLASIKVQRQ